MVVTLDPARKGVGELPTTIAANKQTCNFLHHQQPLNSRRWTADRSSPKSNSCRRYASQHCCIHGRLHNRWEHFEMKMKETQMHYSDLDVSARGGRCPNMICSWWHLFLFRRVGYEWVSFAHLFTGGMLSIQAENTISGDNMSYLLIEPLGNGEANIIPLTMTVIATTYLDKTNQWEKLGFDKRSEALRYIEAGE